MKTINRQKTFIKVFSVAVLVLIPTIALAQFTPTFRLPGSSAGTSSIQAYIVSFYQFGVAIAGILAVGMIIVGGIFYSISGASPDRQSEAKDMISSALWGLALIFGSYLILRTINPALVFLGPPGGGDLKRPMVLCNATSGTPGPQICTEGTPTPEIDPNTGIQCPCYTKPSEPPACPGALKPIGTPAQTAPVYDWVDPKNNPITKYKTFPYIGPNLDDKCTNRVKIPANKEFNTVNCGVNPCYDYWPTVSGVLGYANSYDSQGPYSVETTGWTWPYYPQRASQSKAICLLYAWYDPVDKEVERADLKGLKPCRDFSATVSTNYLTKIKPCSACSVFPPSPTNSVPSKPRNIICDVTAADTTSCQLNTTLIARLKNLKTAIDNYNANKPVDTPPLEWEVTEVWPPTVNHISPCHYNGTCVDIHLKTSGDNCDYVKYLAQLVKAAPPAGGGFTGTVINEYNRCPVTVPGVTNGTFDTTIGGHLHLNL
ncbi:TrbC/VirB2 family protein [Candidatus Jorgensenbacteria bacterium]|nr:TrbC/VirB2 family protein [Candidatus Jorgensenbacteria bacterium]